MRLAARPLAMLVVLEQHLDVACEMNSRLKLPANSKDWERYSYSFNVQSKSMDLDTS